MNKKQGNVHGTELGVTDHAEPYLLLSTWEASSFAFPPVGYPEVANVYLQQPLLFLHQIFWSTTQTKQSFIQKKKRKYMKYLSI